MSGSKAQKGSKAVVVAESMPNIVGSAVVEKEIDSSE
jgi:hypothetical protein